MLSAHGAIYVCPETFFFISVVPKLKAEADVVAAVSKCWWIIDAGITEAELRPRFDMYVSGGMPALESLFRSVMDVHKSRHPGCLIGEKTPDHVLWLPVLRKVFPRAMILHIIRDPRSVLSSYKKVSVGTNQVADVVSEWKQATEVFKSWQGQEGYFSVRYEELVRSPEKILREICSFLGVDWDPRVLVFHDRGDSGFAPEQTHHANTLKPVFTSSIDAWKTDLSRNEIAVIEFYCSEMMMEFGYDLTGFGANFIPLRFAVSRLLGVVHKTFVRYPRQKLKAMHANRRLRAVGDKSVS
jgi:hypothetical protein